MKSNTQIIASVFLVIAATANAADLETTVELCNGCHGDNGVSEWNDMPSIAGIDEFAHSEALFVYRDIARPCAESDFRQGDTDRDATNMCDVVRDMSDEEIEEIAAHYAALPFVPAEQEFDSALAATGESVHVRECSRCHTDGGSNPEDAASILAGQWRGYLERTFADYAAGERDQPAAMKQNMDELSADDIEVLLQYYASQQ